jgi:sugar lactone lactonase YvrE/predicted alpha/beta superfamily hydrolase
MRHLLLLSFLLNLMLCIHAAEPAYPPSSDSLPQPGVPAGTVHRTTFSDSKLYPGTTRDYWVYTPAHYDATQPAPVMILQDGPMYQVTNVLNNLIHKKELPPLVGVFIQPGITPAAQPGASNRLNRSFEYDSLGDRYARFLLEELLPDAAKKFGLNFSTNANDRGIAGNSSGGICAFTAAWERPDAFRRVFTGVGSFTDLRGGLVYPGLIRQTEPKPIRLFLSDGTNDLNNFAGNWWLANQAMLSALEFAGYDVKHAWSEGSHNPKFATQVFPEALRWLWRDWPEPLHANPRGESKQPLAKLLLPGEDWQLVSRGHKFTEGPAVNAHGEVFFTDIPNSLIHKIALDGQVTVFATNTGSANGLMFGGDGRLYACANGRKQIEAYTPDAQVAVLATNVTCNDLVVTPRGDLYFTDPPGKRVWFLPRGGTPVVAAEGIDQANGIALSPDHAWLYVGSFRGQFIHSFQVKPDGALTHKQPYQRLKLADGATQSGADGMTVDSSGRLYATSEIGLQTFDNQGRCDGVISKPQNAPLSNAVFGGANLDELYVTCGDKVFKRRLAVKGVWPWE